MDNIKIFCACDELVDIKAIKKNPRNRNTHPPIQIKGLEKTLAANGIRHPFIVSKKTGYLVTGHGRLAACINLGIGALPVVYQEFKSAAAEYRFMVADNESQRRPYLDTANFFEDLGEIGIDLDLEKDLSGLEDFGIFDEMAGPKKDKDNKEPKVGKKSKIICPKCQHTFLR